MNLGSDLKTKQQHRDDLLLADKSKGLSYTLLDVQAIKEDKLSQKISTIAKTG